MASPSDSAELAFFPVVDICGICFQRAQFKIANIESLDIGWIKVLNALETVSWKGYYEVSSN